MASSMDHWGKLVAKILKSRNVDVIFTLSGGHIFFIYDGAVEQNIRLLDVRHESSAAFAAEGWARLTRNIGVAAVTAGPGVFNSINGLAQAQKNGAPLVLLGGRAPESRWGMGSLQEVDHVPVCEPLTKRASTAGSNLAQQLSEGILASLSPPRGPVFLDFPMDLVMPEESDVVVTDPPRVEPDPDRISKIAKLISESSKPMLIAGSNVYMDGAWESMRAFAEAARIPVYMNGLGRGTIPADHELAFQRSRSKAVRDADVAIVAGTPFDFRLSFGDKFDRAASVIHMDSAQELITTNRELAVGLGADLDLAFRQLADGVKSSSGYDWLQSLRSEEDKLSAEAEAELSSDSTPIHPLRIYRELNKVLDRGAVVVGDGGDFVSYSGREISSYVPGAWLDPGPFGCLGSGPGYAMAAKLLYPNRQVVLLLGDGAFGFSGLEFDTMVRHGLNVVGVMGNNGIWGLEKHPMKLWFGHDVAADLRQETGYDRVVEALGGYGETVTSPSEIAPALKRAFDAGVPALLNIHTDPEVVYPRSANLA